MDFSKECQKYPDFLLRKIDHFYGNRVFKEWNGRYIFEGTIPCENSICLTSNDYLRLSTDSHVLNSQVKAINEILQPPLMSASFICGDAPQKRLERRLASFFESESSILCQSGYVANLGLMQTLVEDMDVPVYIDMMAHMSIWNGIRLGGGKAVPFIHNDTSHLVRKITEYGPGIIVVDSVYSTDGSVAPLCDLAEVARSKQCTLIVDESHSFGTHGPNGKGLVTELGINEVVLLRTASLAKAFASRAGLILCPKEFGDFFSVTSKPQIFSSALMPFDIAGLDSVLDLVDSEIGGQKRVKLSQLYTQLKNLLLEAGIDVSESNSQIMALKVNSENKMFLLKETLEKDGIFGAPFFAPATPRKKPVLRFSLHSELAYDDLERIVARCIKAFTVLQINFMS